MTKDTDYWPCCSRIMLKRRTSVQYTGEAAFVGPDPTRATQYRFNVTWLAMSLAFICFFSQDLIAGAMDNAAKMIGWKYAASASLPVGNAQSLKVWNLSEIAWTVGNDALNISVPGSLPSQVRSSPFTTKGYSAHVLRYI
jgi:hypothetical protein